MSAENWSRVLAISVFAFAITLAVLIADRLSNQALALILGTFIGLMMSIPLCGIVIWLVLRQQREYRSYSSYYGYARPQAGPRYDQPQVIVVQPQQQPSYAPNGAPIYGQPQLTPNTGPTMPAYSPYMRPEREFKIVGQEDADRME